MPPKRKATDEGVSSKRSRAASAPTEEEIYNMPTPTNDYNDYNEPPSEPSQGGRKFRSSYGPDRILQQTNFFTS